MRGMPATRRQALFRSLSLSRSLPDHTGRLQCMPLTWTVNGLSNIVQTRSSALQVQKHIAPDRNALIPTLCLNQCDSRRRPSVRLFHHPHFTCACVCGLCACNRLIRSRYLSTAILGKRAPSATTSSGKVLQREKSFSLSGVLPKRGLSWEIFRRTIRNFESQEVFAAKCLGWLEV